MAVISQIFLIKVTFYNRHLNLFQAFLRKEIHILKIPYKMCSDYSENKIIQYKRRWCVQSLVGAHICTAYVAIPSPIGAHARGK